MPLSKHECGEIAKRYLLWTAPLIPHFDRNSLFIKKIFEDMRANRMGEINRVCRHHVDVFSAELAREAFGEDSPCGEYLPEELFLHLCYVLTVHTFYTGGNGIGRRMKPTLEEHAQGVGIPPEIMREFFKQLTSDICSLL